MTKRVETLFEDQPQAGGYKVTSRTDSPDGNFDTNGPYFESHHSELRNYDARVSSGSVDGTLHMPYCENPAEQSEFKRPVHPACTELDAPEPSDANATPNGLEIASDLGVIS